MTVSEQALAKVKDLPETERPISEQYRLIAKKWLDADAAWYILDELKKTTLEMLKTKLMGAGEATSEAKAERAARCSHEWTAYVHQMADARKKANGYVKQMRYIEMRHREWIGADANARSERKLY